MNEYKRNILDAGKTLLHAGLTVETWGNLSVCDRAAGRVYITPSGRDYDTCVEDDIVCMDLDGKIL